MSSAPIDIPVKVKGLSDLQKLEARMKALEKEVTRLQKTAPKAANNIRKIGPAGKVAAGGMKALGAGIKAALGPIGLALAAIGSLTAAFETLSTQNFAEAKFKSLGGNADELVDRLKGVSEELNGQRSVVELTGAAYDVASAGFNSAAEASQVLKAASLGATGGFAELNTVANATTSVLNAYGLEASAASQLVDQFIQTQNDGKIVVSEYASNIGKVAAAAAALKIPLSEVNAVIAQATASGVQAEVAFTGLKGAIARLASGQASKELEQYGITINAATIESEGLFGTLKKLEGLDTGTIFKALGTESAPALLPILNDLERYEELIKNQESANGTAAKAAEIAADTIQGAWKEVTTALQNLFADQSELGTLIKVTLKGVAIAIQEIAKAFELILLPGKLVFQLFQAIAQRADELFGISEIAAEIGSSFMALVDRIKGLADAIEPIKKIFADTFGTIKNLLSGFGDELLVAFSGPIQTIQELWTNLVDFIGGIIGGMIGVVTEKFESIVGVVTAVTDTIGGLWSSFIGVATDESTTFGSTVMGVWNSIASGVQSVVGAITSAFQTAFDTAWQIVMNFWNALPPWLKGALSAAASVAGAVTGAVTNAIGQVGGEIQNAWNNGGGAQSGLQPPGKNKPQSSTAPPTTATPSGGGGGGGGGGRDLAAEAQKEAEAMRKQLNTSAERLALLEAELKVKEASNGLDEIGYQYDLDKLKIDQETEKLLSKAKSDEERMNIEAAQGIKLKSLGLDLAEDIEKREDQIYGSLRDQQELLTARINGNSEEVELKQQIRDATEGLSTAEAGRVESLIRGNAELEKQAQKVEELEQSWKQLKNSAVQAVGSAIEDSIITGIESAIQGTEDLGKKLQEIASGLLKDVGRMFLKFGLNAIMPSFSGGGYTGDAPRAGGVDGQGGFPALLHPQETVIDNSKMSSGMSRWNAGNSAGGEEMAAGGGGMGAELPAQITINGGVTQMGGNDYIRADQMNTIISQAGKAGEARALRRLQMSPSSRRKVGV